MNGNVETASVGIDSRVAKRVAAVLIAGVVCACSGGLSISGGADGDGNGNNTPRDEVALAGELLVGGAGSVKPGYTLYVFDDDLESSGSTCDGGCADLWPPVLVVDSVASGIGNLSTIARDNGSVQAAYKGRPLYFYALDHAPGATNGHGAGAGKWWVATTATTNESRTITGGGDTPNAGNSLLTNQELGSGERLESTNGDYRFNLQGDGNLVLRDRDGNALWASGTNGDGGVRLVLQGDGNLVLYTAANVPVWASGTNGTGVDHLVMNNDGSLALYAGNDVAWSVNGSGETGNGGGANGSSRNEHVSTPSSALYSLNSSRERAFPKHVQSFFQGNGHAETWDGRVFVRTRTDGWFGSAFRPEKIAKNGDGTPDFGSGAFGSSLPVELNVDRPDVHHNWLAITPDPAVTSENPYPSDSTGNYQKTGTHRTYKALVYHTLTNKNMGLRKATFIVSNAETPNAQLITAEFTSTFAPLRFSNGQILICIEPSVTIDSRMVIAQGHPDNDGKIDNLIYAWTATPGSANNWTQPKSIADMHYDDRNSDVDGVPFRVRYAMAEQPITDATGKPYAKGELVKGAYPWVSHDGSELFYQASNEGVSARRTGTSVVGRWTGWTIRHIDGPINRNRHLTSKLFLSSPGAFTTMWSPYKDVKDLVIPYSVHGPSYPIFGSNTEDYSEISFEDYVDGNYVLYLGMNEQLNRAGNYQVTKSNDTSGNFNNATLVGAKFPLEYNSQDELVGRYGQAIYFPANTYLDVDRRGGWSTLARGVSVELWIKKLQAGSGRVQLFELANGVEVYLDNATDIAARIEDEQGNSQVLVGSQVATNSWVHVAFTYDPATKEMALYLDAVEVAERTASGLGLLRTSGDIRVGPDGSNCLMILDEVKVSNVARSRYEIAHSANVNIKQQPSAQLMGAVPDHFQLMLDRVSNVDRFSTAAAQLGEDLFEDKILSKEQTTSCATCHDPSKVFTDGRAIAKGNEPTDAGTRNTPMLHNRLFSTLQGWSGGASSLDKQALVPIAAPHEMNLPIPEAVARLKAHPDYANRFQQVYGEEPNEVNLPAALAAFEAIQFSPRTRVDDYKAGNLNALSDSERRGLLLFEGKARCSGCHSGRNYTDESFRNTGLVDNADNGRAEITGRERDYKLFKVPSLRMIGRTAPYMHDGSLATLADVVAAYNRGERNSGSVDTDIRPLELSAQEQNDLVQFLMALQ